MTQCSVAGILIVKYNTSNYKALYGRIRRSTSYTKDYIQIPREVSEELRTIFGNDEDRVEIEYVWPGEGGREGYFKWSNDRYHLGWGTDTPPPPWTLGKVGDDLVASLNGDITLRLEADGDRQFRTIEESNQNPWLLAIILAGDENRLHLRVYFEHPPVGLPDRGTGQLPGILQDKIDTLKLSEAGSSFVNCSNTTPPPVRAKNLVIEVEEALTRNPNVLLIGPPGSSKSVALEDLNKLYSSNSAVSAVLFDPDSWNGDWAEVNEPLTKCISLTFHAAYMYENFVAGLYPKSFPEGGIKLEAIPGPLLCMSHWVGDTERKGLLILDEFNRGHAAAIFGDTLSLLDKEKRSTSTNDGAHILRPYSEQPMPVPDSFRRGEADQEEIEQNVRIPANVHIVAAMNSTDRSVAPLDAALRRRFAVIRVLPDYEVLASHFKIDIQRAEQPLPSSHEVTDWEVDDVSVLAVKLLRHLNERIEFCLGEDFLLGHGLLWDLESDDKKERLKQLAYCVDHFVVPTLRTTFIDQDDALAAVLGISSEQQANNSSTASPITGSVAYWKIAPAGLTDIVAKRLVIQEIHKMGINHQVAALVALSSSS